MKIVLSVILLLIVAAAGHFWLISNKADTTVEVVQENEAVEVAEVKEILPTIIPISHASFILEWEDLVIYNDPVGEIELYADQRPANIVLVSDVHGDHLDAETLKAVVGTGTLFIVPQAVADQLPEELLAKATVLNNGKSISNYSHRVAIEAIPMYNLPEQGIEIRHEAGRGNGYIIDRDKKRIYIAGDTAAIPEMRALTNIEIAFIPMNLPFTMSVEDAADGVVAFKPKQVYAYHYRSPDGLADVALFRQLVNKDAPEVEVVQLDWYPERSDTIEIIE